MRINEVVPIAASASSQPEVIRDIVEPSYPEVQTLGVGVKDNSRISFGRLNPSVEVDLIEEVTANMNANIARMHRQRPLNQANHALKGRILVAQQVSVVLTLPTQGRVHGFHGRGVTPK